MLNINFSYNWNNKLNCKAFTTVRLRNDSKYFTNNVYSISLTRKDNVIENFNNAKCVAIKHFKLSALTEFIAHVDTGYSKAEFETILKRMYQNKNINWETQELSLILLKYNK